MKTYSLERYLRKNPPGKKGDTGTYSLRLYWTPNKKMKSRRVEIGLNTSNLEEAFKRAIVFLNGVYVLGGKFSSKIHIGTYKGDMVPLHDALPIRDTYTPGEMTELPLFKFSMQFLPPFNEVENEAKDE